MIPWVHLDTARIPDGGEIRLKQRGQEFSIMLGDNELMNSRLSGSEEALATLACAKLTNPAPHILIGGLGMGFTLRAALAVLGPQAQVTVAELVPGVIGWARGPMATIFGTSLNDSRVRLIEADVGALIRNRQMPFDAILLDVDNGPEGLSRAGNDALYDHSGLVAARAALCPGGVLAVWSQGPEAGFAARCRKAGFVVEDHRVRAHGQGRSKGRGGARHVVWLGVRG